MKKLALLQLFLLPLAGFAEGRSYENSAAQSGEQSAVDVAWDRCEAGLKDLAKRLVRSSYAQHPRGTLRAVGSR